MINIWNYWPTIGVGRLTPTDSAFASRWKPNGCDVPNLFDSQLAVSLSHVEPRPRQFAAIHVEMLLPGRRAGQRVLRPVRLPARCGGAQECATA
jgi:hypothetical protein